MSAEGSDHQDGPVTNASDNPIDRRPLASRNTLWAQRLAQYLAESSITPNRDICRQYDFRFYGRLGLRRVGSLQWGAIPCVHAGRDRRLPVKADLQPDGWHGSYRGGQADT